MSFIIKDKTYVDEKYAPVVEKVYFMDNVLIPGVTYTDKYQMGTAGQVYVHKPKKSTVTAHKPGEDFTSAVVEDTLIALPLDHEFQADRKVLGVTEAMVAYDRAASELDLATQSVAEARQKAFLAIAANEGTSGAAVTLTTENVEAELLRCRKAIRDAGGTVSAWIVNTDVYNLILQMTKRFTPETNEQMRQLGIAGRLYGAPVIEANMLSGKITLIDGTTQVDFDKINFLAIDYRGFSILDALSVARLKDSENFYGMRAQVQSNCGAKATNPAFVQVSKHA